MKAVRLVFGGILAAAALFSQGTPAPFVKPQWFDNNGRPAAGASLCSYLAGTSTPRATFSDAGLTQANPQCAPLDASGRASIWMDSAVVYRFVLRDSTGVTLWTVDNIPGSGSGILTGGNLWTQSGNTVYNSSGNRVCIGATPCTSALATLDVAGASSGTNFLIRVDDTGNNPGINLYGSGVSYGSVSADPTGLRLRAGDGTIQATVSPSQFLVRNATTGAGTTQLNVQATATQGTARLMQFITNTGNTMSFVDQLGRIVTTDTNNDSIFASAGGVAGKYLTAIDSLFLLAEAQPAALSGAGQARIYLDQTSPMQLYASIDGGAYAPIGSGGGGGGGGSFSAITAGTNITAAMLVGTGASLGVTGSGTINATAINGTPVPVNSAADQVLLTSASATGSWSGVPDCPDTSQHLNYTHGGGFTCGTTGGSTGSVLFSGIATGTNTSATMTVGTGASLITSGTGTISATQINLAGLPVSGSVWKSNSSLQAVAAGAADIIAMFSGCSGSQYLGADGACHTAGGGGGGSFLPLAGGTMAGNIVGSGTQSLGSPSAPWGSIYLGTSNTIRPTTDANAYVGLPGFRFADVQSLDVNVHNTIKFNYFGSMQWNMISGSLNTLSWRDAGSNTRMRLDASGAAGLTGTGVSLTAPSIIAQPTNSASIPLYVAGYPGQSADLFQVWDGIGGTKRLSVASNGTVTAGVFAAGPVSAGATNGYLFSFGSNAGVITTGNVLASHYASSAGTPSVSGSAGCSLAGGSNDTRGSFACSSGGTLTLNFATAFGTAPFCVVNENLGLSSVTSSGTSAVTFQLGGIGGGLQGSYICMQ